MSNFQLNGAQTLAYDKAYNQHPWLTGNVNPIAVEKADGIYFWDYDGKRYADMGSRDETRRGKIVMIAPGHHFNDVSETVVMGMFCSKNNSNPNNTILHLAEVGI